MIHTPDPPRIKAIAPWFGGKRTLAPEIVRELGEHTQYFEPFCGSMAVLLAKTPSSKETVNDMHGGMFGDDHTRLAALLRGYRAARVVVSYYDDPRIRRLYDGWTFVSHAMQKNLHCQNGRGARRKDAPEVLIINGPSYAREVER